MPYLLALNCDDAFECANDAACVANFPNEPFCINGTCEECVSSAQCERATPNCRNNTCTSFCTRHAECGGNRVLCLEGNCTPVECVEDDDCPDGTCNAENACEPSSTPTADVRLFAWGQADLAVSDGVEVIGAETGRSGLMSTIACTGATENDGNCVGSLEANVSLTFSGAGVGETPVFGGWCNGCFGEPATFTRTLPESDGALACFAAATDVADEGMLANLIPADEASFEMPPEARLGPDDLVFDEWRGDLRAHVGAENGVTPRTGTRMVRCEASAFEGGSATSAFCEVLRWYDLHALRADAGVAPGEPLRLRAWGYVNRAPGPDSEQLFGVRIQWYRGILADRFSGGVTPEDDVPAFRCADDDPATWEQVAIGASFPDPGIGPAYVELRAYAAENLSNGETDEFTGHYLDDFGLAIVD